jgi:16S rRNA (guanine(966)-N(2))-methyltransferase RsmD
MRVIGGKAKGRKLRRPKSLRVRPTSDRVKEALFNIISSKVSGAKVLDAFAGAGSLGIEALSRGAESAVFVEKDSSVVKYLYRNLKETGFEPKSQVLVEDVRKALSRFRKEGKKFSLIFLDPPYKINPEILEEIVEEALFLVEEGGVVVLEHSSKLKIENEKIFKQKVYGDTALSFFKNLR